MRNARTSKLFVIICAGLMTFWPAKAAPLATGQTAVALSFENEPIGATLLATTTASFSILDLPYSQRLKLSGSLVSSVWAGDTSNPYGGLTFTYKMSNDLGYFAPVEGFSLKNYSSFLTDVAYNDAGVVPMHVGRSDNRVNFRFGSVSANDPWLHPGLTSATLVIQTDAQAWNSGSAFIFTGFNSTDNIAILAPSAVPEPTMLALAIIGFAAIANRKRH